jgi:hypothetical protein
VARIEKAIALGKQLQLGLALDQGQEVYFNCLQQYIVPHCLVDDSTTGNIPQQSSCRWNLTQIKPLLKLGQSLAIDVSCWL